MTHPATGREEAERAADVTGGALDCGHYLPEEKPDEVLDRFMRFFGG